MMRRGTLVEYRGWTLEKKSKSSWLLIKDGNIIGYASTLRCAKQGVDRNIEKEDN